MDVFLRKRDAVPSPQPAYDSSDSVDSSDDSTEINDGSVCSSEDGEDGSRRGFCLKDWLKLVRVVASKHETSKNKLADKYDELQDFFYFFAVEYFASGQDSTETVERKRKEFQYAWRDTIGACDSVFYSLVDLIDDINKENSFI